MKSPIAGLLNAQWSKNKNRVIAWGKKKKKKKTTTENQPPPPPKKPEKQTQNNKKTQHPTVNYFVVWVLGVCFVWGGGWGAVPQM